MVRLSKGAESNQCAETPPDLLYAIENRYAPIRFDLAASKQNAKARWYFTEEQDSLAQDWVRVAKMLFNHFDTSMMFLNPPFRNISPWAQKCAETQRQLPVGVYIGLLIPASPGANYWRDYIDPFALTDFLNGRPCFDGQHPFPKDCSFSLYGRAFKSGYRVWEWKKDVPEHLIITPRKEVA